MPILNTPSEHPLLRPDANAEDRAWQLILDTLAIGPASGDGLPEVQELTQYLVTEDSDVGLASQSGFRALALRQLQRSPNLAQELVNKTGQGADLGVYFRGGLPISASVLACHARALMLREWSHRNARGMRGTEAPAHLDLYSAPRGQAELQPVLLPWGSPRLRGPRLVQAWGEAQTTPPLRPEGPALASRLLPSSEPGVRHLGRWAARSRVERRQFPTGTMLWQDLYAMRLVAGVEPFLAVRIQRQVAFCFRVEA